MVSIKKIGLSVIASLLMLGTSLVAQDLSKKEMKTQKLVQETKTKAKVNEKATGLSATMYAKKAFDYLGNLDGYSFNATVMNEDALGLDNMMLFLTHKYKVDLSSPGKLRMVISGDMDKKTIYIDNGNVTVISGDKATYAKVKVSEDLDLAIEDLDEKYGFVVPLQNFLYSDVSKDFPKKKKGYYLGTADVDGAECYYLAFPGKKWDIQLWIETGKKPLVRRVAYTDKTTKGNPRSFIRLNWDTTPTYTKETFVPKIPEKAIKAKILSKEETAELKKSQK